MPATIIEEFHRSPSTVSYMVRAFLPSPGRRWAGAFPSIVERWSQLRIDGRHQHSFRGLTGLPVGGRTLLLYPHVFGFPLQMALLTHPAFPLPIWRALQIRNHLLLHRTFAEDEVLDLETRVAGQRILERGAEVDLHTTLSSAGERVWESLNTFFYRGRYGPLQDASPLARAPEGGGPEAARWHMPSGVGWRFGGLTGDYNGIHLQSWYARLFGFKAAFHHPQLVLGQCLARLPAPSPARQRLDAWLKGPVFYDSDVRLQASGSPEGIRFSLWLGGETRPSLVGHWHAEPPGSRLVDEQGVPLPSGPEPMIG